MRFLPFLLVSLLLLPGDARAAASAQPLTPLNTSVRGGEQQVYSARFFDGLGRPAAGETVRFANDACGTFSNGGLAMDAATDATGTASATFTARPQGITCTVTATAGVTVRFHVNTYTAAQVAIVASLSPARPRPGQPFTLVAGAYAGAYPIYEANLAAAVVSQGGSASLSPASASSGQDGRVGFDVMPSLPLGDFAVDVTFGGVTRRVVVEAPASPLQDLWWGGPAENGWGLSLVQHREQLFGVLYAYDGDGRPTWLVLPGGTWNATRTVFTAPLYSPRGTPYTAYDASRLEAGEPVGSATLAFDGLNRATLAYEIGGVRGTRAVQRQLFGPPRDVAPPREVGDMWWGGVAQNGWGLAVLQQHSAIFAVWYTYDESGRPTWFVMPSGAWQGDATWAGRIYRTSGSPWLAAPYDPAALRSVEVGSFEMRFAGDEATFAYTIDGRAGTLALERQPF